MTVSGSSAAPLLFGVPPLLAALELREAFALLAALADFALELPLFALEDLLLLVALLASL